MTLHRISPDPFAVYPHLEMLKMEPPKDGSRYDLARRRAAEVFDDFVESPEAAALSGGGWCTLVMRVAYVHHSVTIDELTPDVLRSVAARIVLPDEIPSLSHWVAVVHDELVAFFRFLDRKGHPNAAANLRLLEDELLPTYDARLKELCHAATEEISFESLDEALGVSFASGVFRIACGGGLTTPSVPPRGQRRMRTRKAGSDLLNSLSSSPSTTRRASVSRAARRRSR
jgi:hypothetical protein